MLRYHCCDSNPKEHPVSLAEHSDHVQLLHMPSLY